MMEFLYTKNKQRKELKQLSFSIHGQIDQGITKMNKTTLSMLMLVLSLSSTALAQEESSLNDALRKHLKKEYFSLGLLIQTEGRFSFRDDGFQGGRSINAAAARLSVSGKLDGSFFYRLYADVISGPALLDAFVGYEVSDALSISFGAMKPQQSLDYIPDPGDHNFVDRATITGLLVESREIGLAVTGDAGGFMYYAGAFNGSGLSENTNNRFYGVGRLEYSLRQMFPGYARFAVSASHGNSEGVISGSSGPLLRGKRSILGADMEASLKDLYLAAEYLHGRLQTVDVPDGDDVIRGYYLTGGYRLFEDVMTLLRWQSWSQRAANASYEKVTFGVNIDLAELVAFVMNIDAYRQCSEKTQFGASFILQVAF
jgi:hypothetical protein